MLLLISDNNLHLNFRPLTLTRPICELRFGILTIKESWKMYFTIQSKSVNIYYETEKYLSKKFSSTDNYDFKIAGNIKPNKNIITKILSLGNNESLYCNGNWVATKGHREDSKTDIIDDSLLELNNIWDLFQKNNEAIQVDFNLLTHGRISAPISDTNQIINPDNIFIEKDVKLEFSTLNATNGPIYIGSKAEVMEGSMIRGGFALLDHAVVKMGAKIYGATTIGPFCKIGGEVSNCIFQSYSNKGHDGFIGNSVIGEWCNLGADTNSSNLKNNYGKVKIHSYTSNRLEQTNNTFCGVLMGDHSKTGINTMLNTATTVGVNANIFGAQFPPKFIPSYSWGGFENSPKYKLEKAFEVGENMMQRRGLSLSKLDKDILTFISNNNL
jgi:UDP-N-acetylglucosamine diphosphorylase/glucosamine-1-phosphate N-acetyltransferase